MKILIDNAGGVRIRYTDGRDYALGQDLTHLTRESLQPDELALWLPDVESYPPEDWDEDYLVAEWQGGRWVLHPNSASHSARHICALLDSRFIIGPRTTREEVIVAHRSKSLIVDADGFGVSLLTCPHCGEWIGDPNWETIAPVSIEHDIYACGEGGAS